MVKLRKWLLHNTSLKIISAILAFIIWLMVSNSANPETTETVYVPITILNENIITGSNKVYTIDRESVSVSYKIRSNDVSNVKPAEFTVFADFKDIDKNGSVPLLISVSENALEYIDDVNVFPSEVKVSTDNIQQKKFLVGHTLIGDVEPGYVKGVFDITPDYLYVKGPVSAVGQISSAGIAVDISGATEDISGTAEILFYDANGNVLPNIGSKLSYAGGIYYTLPVYRTKSLSVNAFTGGSPAGGYYVEGVEISPAFITVYGTEEALSKHSYVLIPGTDLNINGESKSRTITVNAADYLPEGLSLAQPNVEIVIYVKIREIPDNETQTEAPSTAEHHETETGTAPGSDESESETHETGFNASETEKSAEHTETGAPEEPETEYSEERTPEQGESFAKESAEPSHGDDV